MRLALKVLVGVFAVIGAAYSALALYVYLLVPSCTYGETPQTLSPDARYFAVFEQTNCKDVAKSWSRVVLGKRGSKERFVVVEGQGPSQLMVTWGGPAELVVWYPAGATFKQLGTDGDLPRVTLRPLEQ